MNCQRQGVRVSEIITSFSDAAAPEGEQPYFCFCAGSVPYGFVRQL